MIQLVDYELSLSDGSRITVVELDPARVADLLDAEVVRACSGMLERCTFAPRYALEEAKKGYDRELLKLLRSPEGGLLRASPAVCRLISDCAMAAPPVCTLRNLRKGKGGIPQCWEYEPGEGLPERVRRSAIELGTAVGSAWREGAYPVIVDLDAAAIGSVLR